MKYRYRQTAYTERTSQTTPLKNAIQNFLKSQRMERRYNYALITNSWEDIVGKTVASRTTKMFVKDSILFVEVNSAPLKNELCIAKTKILEKIEEFVGEKVLNDIRFI